MIYVCTHAGILADRVVTINAMLADHKADETPDDSASNPTGNMRGFRLDTVGTFVHHAHAMP